MLGWGGGGHRKWNTVPIGHTKMITLNTQVMRHNAMWKMHLWVEQGTDVMPFCVMYSSKPGAQSRPGSPWWQAASTPALIWHPALLRGNKVFYIIIVGDCRYWRKYCHICALPNTVAFCYNDAVGISTKYQYIQTHSIQYKSWVLSIG